MKKLLIFLVFLVYLIGIYPLISQGLAGTFYRIDPDTVYLGNALMYVKDHKISYSDHPGTPSIVLFSYSFTPLRIFIHKDSVENFIDWSFANFAMLTFYLRIFCSLIFLVSVFIFLGSLRKATGSWPIVVCALFTLLTYSYFLPMSTAIMPEAISFLLVAFWLLLISYILKDKKWGFIPTLFVVSGVALANKFTNLVLLLSSIVVLLIAPKYPVKRKILNLPIYLGIFALIFYLSIYPIRANIPYLINWVKALFGHSQVYGGGRAVVFDINDYASSFSHLFSNDPVLILSLVFTLILILKAIIRKKTTLIKSEVILFFITLTFFLIFAKYPVAHYQLSNFLLLIYLSLVIVHKYYKNLVVILAMLLIPAGIFRTMQYSQNYSQKIQTVATLERYIQQNAPQKGGLWSYSPTKEFALIWSRTWSPGVFASQFKGLTVPMLEASTEDIVLPDSEFLPGANLFDLCWDRAYLDRKLALSMTKKYPQYLHLMNLSFGAGANSIPIDLVESSHCSKSL